jgi:hypothetical protein
MLDAGFDISFRDCPTKGGTGGHPKSYTGTVVMEVQRIKAVCCAMQTEML